MISRSDIEAAADRIRPHVRVTPVMHLEAGEFGVDCPVSLKLELLQRTGSFKPRGAFNRILSADLPASGVIAASGGNHGAAVAYAARSLGLRAEIFVPEPTPSAKIARIAEYGAAIVRTGSTYADALRASEGAASGDRGAGSPRLRSSPRSWRDRERSPASSSAPRRS